jgi:hypothetical protein
MEDEETRRLAAAFRRAGLEADGRLAKGATGNAALRRVFSQLLGQPELAARMKWLFMACKKDSAEAKQLAVVLNCQLLRMR